MDSSVTDSVMEESVFESMVYKQDADGHSKEDVIWADSCLVKVSENEWDSLKNSLLEILDSVEPSTDETDHLSAEFSLPDHESPKLDDAEETIKTVNYSYSTSSDDEEDDDEISSHVGVSHMKKIKSRSRANVGNSSVAVIHEFLQDNNTYDFGLDFSFAESIVPEPTAGEIFKVWDLDIPPEEDELLTDLKKALIGSPLHPTKEDDLNLKGFSNCASSSLDELIMGMTDLSLDSNPDEAY